MINSKQKGASWERRCCKQLSLWITNGKKEDCLWRSAMSGGRATIAYRKGQSIRQCGDITAVAPEGFDFCDQYYIECKALKSFQFMDFLLMRGVSFLIWKRTWQEAHKHERLPMLIIKRNHWPTLLITSAAGMGWLRITDTLRITMSGAGCRVALLEDVLAKTYIPRISRPSRTPVWLTLDKIMAKFHFKTLQNDCIFWKTESPQTIVVEGQRIGMSRFVCSVAHGPPNSPELDAAHNCGNGHLGCVNPLHLAWKTKKENQADRLIHGTHNRGERHGNAKLNNEQVLKIKALKGIDNAKALASQFGVGQAAIQNIWAGRRWDWLETRPSPPIKRIPRE
jgi:hypothetical protein